MYIVLCCARVREIFLSPSREIHSGHNVSQQSYAVVKIFCPGKIAIPRSKKRSSPKGLVNTVSNWRAMILTCFLFFFLSLAKRAKNIARASVRLFSRTRSYQAAAFSHCFPRGWLLSTRLNFSTIRDCRLHWALCTQCSGAYLPVSLENRNNKMVARFTIYWSRI